MANWPKKKVFHIKSEKYLLNYYYLLKPSINESTKYFFCIFHRYHHQDVIRYPAITSSPGNDITDGTHSITGSQNVFNVAAPTPNAANSYSENWSESGAVNKVVFLNTPPPPPHNTR